VISTPLVRKAAIRRHYDLATVFYRLLWGPHIHHGLWDADELPAVATRRLIDLLAREARVGPGTRLLDVGCGMGGSAVYLARHLGCDSTGLTLSPVQRAWAATAARWHGVGRRVRVLCRDAEAARFRAGTFDVVWSVECTEHLFDKPAFFQKAARWLRPGGRVAICAWLAGDEPHSPAAVRLVRDVCDGFLCPSLGTAREYTDWLEDAGLQIRLAADLTERVSRTWEICLDRVRRSRVGVLARLVDRDQEQFLQHFATILEAYRTGAMKYGCFVAASGRA